MENENKIKNIQSRMQEVKKHSSEVCVSAAATFKNWTEKVDQKSKVI